MTLYFGYEIEIHFPYKNIVVFPMNFVIFSEFLEKYISLSISEPSDEMDAISVFHDCVFTWLVSVSLSFKVTLFYL